MDGRLNGTEEILVRVTTKAGKVTLMRVPAEHLQRVLDLANTHYGDAAKVIGGPRLVQPKLEKKSRA